MALHSGGQLDSNQRWHLATNSHQVTKSNKTLKILNRKVVDVVLSKSFSASYAVFDCMSEVANSKTFFLTSDIRAFSFASSGETWMPAVS